MSRTRYNMELESVRRNLAEMGETDALLLSEALHAIVEPNSAVLAKASELESQTDHQHRMIHDQCLSLITLQAPVASDARLVTGALNAIVDLELIGDYAYEIVTLSSSLKQRPPSPILVELSETGAKIQEILADAIDSWRTGQPADALSIRSKQATIQAECEDLYEKLPQLLSSTADASTYVDLMLISKHLERILRHAVSVADEAADAVPLQQNQ